MTATTASTVTMTGAQFHQMFGAVLPSASTDDTLPQLNAVHVEVGPHGAYAAATDRYTFAVARHADPDPRRHPVAVTIPRAAVVAMLRLAGRRDTHATMRVTSRHLSLRTTAGITYTAPGINTSTCAGFPDWRRLLRRVLTAPEAPGQPVHLNPAYLARFAAVSHTTGLRITTHQPAGNRSHVLVITAGDWFIGALMTLTTGPQQVSTASGPAAWHADLSPARAA